MFGIQKKAHEKKETLISVITEVVDSGIFLNGTKNEQLKQRLRMYLGGGYVLPVSSGHDALMLAIQSLGCTKEDEILFPVNAYPSAFPVVLSGATPVPVEIDNNGQIDIGSVRQKCTKKTKAILVVHLYGLMADIREIVRFARSHSIYLIEDVAQAFGSRFNNKLAGTFGDISCFSFYPTKNLGALGDGGAIWTKSKRLYTKMRQASRYGEHTRYKSLFISGHSRLPEIQASALTIYLRDFRKDQVQRKRLYTYYKSALTKMNLSKRVRFLSPHVLCDPTIHLFVVAAFKRDALWSFLRKRGIETHIHYPYPIHTVPAFRYLVKRQEKFPNAEKLAKQIISLPFHPYLTKREIDYIVEAITSFYKRL